MTTLRCKNLTALLTLDPVLAQEFANQHGITGEIHSNPQVLEMLQKGIDEQVNIHFARVEQVRKFKILPRDFTIEDGELTPTLKIKLRIFNQNFEPVIESMYQE